MKRAYYLTAAVLAGLLLAMLGGCGRQTEYAGLDGTWAVVENGLNTSSFGVGVLDHLGFDTKTGQVFFYGAMEGSGLRGCGKGLASFGQNRTLSLYFGGGMCSLGTITYGYELTGSGEAVLRDPEGRTLRLRKLSGPPAEVVCKQASFVGQPLQFDFDLASGSNLLSDGSSLRVVDSRGYAFPIDLAAGVMGPGAQITTSRYFHAFTMQGDYYWSTSNSGSLQDARLYALGNSLQDQLDTNALGHRMSIGAGAYDGDYLVLKGMERGSHESVYMKVDVAPNPNVLMGYVHFGLPARALTFHGGELWALVHFGGVRRYRLVAFDPVAGEISDSYDLPLILSGNVEMRGLADLNGTLYVMGSDNGKIYIYQVGF